MNRYFLSIFIMLGLLMLAGIFVMHTKTPATAAVSSEAGGAANRQQASQGAAPTATPTPTPTPTATTMPHGAAIIPNYTPSPGPAWHLNPTSTPPPTPIPTCAPVQPTPPGVTPSPTALPDFSPDAPVCVNMTAGSGLRSEASQYDGPPGPGSIPANPNAKWCMPALGLGTDCPSTETENGNSADTDRENASSVQQASATGTFAHAVQYMKCSSVGNPCTKASTGIDEITANMTGRKPTLKPLKVWRNYHYYNRLQISHLGYPISCPASSGIPYSGPETISVGFATGVVGTTLYNNEMIVETIYKDANDNVVCSTKGTGRVHNDHAAVYVSIARGTNGWEIRAWFGEWVPIATVPTRWEVSPNPDYGQEVWARYGDLASIKAPLNFIHKASIKGGLQTKKGPWHEAYLGHPLNGRSGDIANPPFAVNDFAPYDYTSISSCIIDKNRFCD